MSKIDLRKELNHLYAPSASEASVVDVPEMKFLTVEGRIEPGASPETSTAFQEALTVLYGGSYTLKFMSKLRKDDPIDYTVMALEGLWWSDAGEFDISKPGEWQWTLMMMQPDHITDEMFQEAVDDLRRKKNPPALPLLRFSNFQEGLSVQIMHIGPYSDEPPTIEKMHAFAKEKGYRLRGKHHEIYIGDPRRAKPEKLKTVLRHPVES